MPLRESAEVGAAHLLLAVEDELEPYPGGDAVGAHQLDGREVGPDGALVVGGTPRVQPVLGQKVIGHVGQTEDWSALVRGPEAQDRLEGRGLEPAGRRGRLDVVVAVDQNRPAGPRQGERAVNCRIAAGLHHAGIQSASPHGPGQPLAAGADPIGVLAHRIQAQELGQSLQYGLAAGHDRLLQAGPGAFILSQGQGHGAYVTRL